MAQFCEGMKTLFHVVLVSKDKNGMKIIKGCLLLETYESYIEHVMKYYIVGQTTSS